MSDEVPKLFDHKPKKSKSKAARTASPAAGATPTPPPPTPPPPTPTPPPLQQPPPPRAPPVKFYKGLAVVVSLVAGAYVFARTVLKVGTPKEEKPEDPIPTTSTSLSTTHTSATTTDTAVAITGHPVTPPTLVEAIQRPPIPEAQQRELLKWILEEKRKAKPRDADEKKRTDEEKAVLKQLIKAKSIPTI